jgi:alkylhydroperoxidase family enzyme
VIEALRAGKPIRDPRLAALAEFTATMVQKRGNPTDRDVRHFLEAGFTEANILEITLAIAVKTLSNYSNHVFHTPVDEPFQAFAWQPAHRAAERSET